MKLGRNEPCWCGSGTKYKKCHLDRSAEQPLPVGAAEASLRKFFKVKECLHPSASSATCGKIIAAHTIQAMGPLKEILDTTGHCLSFYPPSSRDDGRPHLCGRKDASTFAGFCDRHDGPTFAPLETIPFEGSAEQCFLLAYRAECHELYQKQASVRSQEPMRQMLDRGQSHEVQREIQAEQYWQGEGVKKGLEDSLRNKRQMDDELLKGQFSGWQRRFLRFSGPLSVVTTAAPTPNKTLDGAELQVLHDDSAKIERFYIGAAVDAPNRHGFAFSWRNEDAAVDRFMGELQKIPLAELPSILVQFIFAHVENTYFSRLWWDQLPDVQKAHIGKLAVMGNPFYDDWAYIENLNVPWRDIEWTEQWA